MPLALLVVTLGAVLITALGVLGLLGKLPPNAWAGIRTRYTRSSDEAWYRTHREAAPLLVFGGIAGSSAGVAFLPFALAGRISDGLIVAVVVGQALVIGVATVLSGLIGTRRARRVAGD